MERRLFDQAPDQSLPPAPISPLDAICIKVGADLKKLRKMRKLSQSEVAETLGVSRYTLLRIESGDMGVAIGTVIALARLYDAPTSFLDIFSEKPAKRKSPGARAENFSML